MKMIAEGLVEGVPDAPRLVGGRHQHSGRMVFPLPEGAAAADFERVTLGDEGRLWSYTVQRFAPKEPFLGNRDQDTFTPYALGYVELPGQLIVQTRIDTDNFLELRLGMPMKLTLIPFARDESGEDLYTFAFKPI